MSQFKVDDRLFRELREKIGEAANAHVKVGVLQSQGGGNSVEGADLTLAELAAIHEYGAPKAGIPARSFLRNTFFDSEGREATAKFLTSIGRAVIAEKLEVDKALDRLGAWAVSQVKRRIKAHIPPELKPETLKRKLGKHGAGGSTPLIATGQLLNSITSEIKK